MNTDYKDFHFQALTDLWTGDAKQQNNRLINIGLLGSIRWWFEVLVRGLDGAACDPTQTKCSDEKHCVVCELFGCTGWARKFRFEVLDGNGAIRVKDKKYSPQIQANEKFILRFIPLRSICEKEWALLELSLRLIAEYGAIGGKTVLKPSDEPNRANEDHHKDYGIVELIEPLPSVEHFSRQELEKLKQYVRSDRWKKLAVSSGEKKFSWASLQNFWCVKGRYLTRKGVDESSFNYVIGRQEPKNKSRLTDSWLAGFSADSKKKIEAESKKVFSFKNLLRDPPRNLPRTFGFVENTDIENWNTIKKKLNELKKYPGWENFDIKKDFLTGSQIIECLFNTKEGEDNEF